MALLGGFSQAFSMLAQEVIFAARRQKEDDELLQTAEALTEARSVISEFQTSAQPVITLAPRTICPNDKVKPLPGQHAGVAVQYVDAVTGSIVRMNFYGGLRDPLDHRDMHDCDPAMKNNHASRTEEVVSQPVRIDLHIIAMGQIEPFLDIWLNLKPTTIALDTFQYDQQYHKVGNTLPLTDPKIAPAVTCLRGAMRNLMLLVPNPWSPR